MPHADPDIKRAYHRNYMRERYRHDRAHRERAKSHTATSAKRRRQQVKARLDEIRAAGCSRCGATPDTAEIHFRATTPAHTDAPGSNGYLHLPPLHTLYGEAVIGGVVKKPGLSLAVKDGCVVTPMPAGRVQLPTDDYFTGPAA